MSQMPLDKVRNTVDELDKVATETYRELMKLSNAMDTFKHGLITALAIQKIGALLTPEIMQQIILPLKDCGKLGFRTDESARARKNYPPYSTDQIKQVMIEACVNGLRVTGNEINIIAGNLYATREAYERKVSELDGLTDLEVVAEVPSGRETGALVPMHAKWLLNGQKMELKQTFAVRLNEGQGADAAIGKATRKLMLAIYRRCTGSRHSPMDGDVDDGLPEEAKPVSGTVVSAQVSKPAQPAASRGDYVRARVAAAAAEEGEFSLEQEKPEAPPAKATEQEPEPPKPAQQEEPKPKAKRGKKEPEPTPEPKAAEKAPADAGTEESELVLIVAPLKVREVTLTDGSKQQRIVMRGETGTEYLTMDTALAREAAKAQKENKKVRIYYIPDNSDYWITRLETQ